MDGIAFDGKCTCFLGIESFSCFQNLSNFLESDSPGKHRHQIAAAYIPFIRVTLSWKATALMTRCHNTVQRELGLYWEILFD
jgi:hypothetical protein